MCWNINYLNDNADHSKLIKVFIILFVMIIQEKESYGYKVQGCLQTIEFKLNQWESFMAKEKRESKCRWNSNYIKINSDGLAASLIACLYACFNLIKFQKSMMKTKNSSFDFVINFLKILKTIKQK